MSTDLTIGEFIKSKRKEKGYTLEQVGNYVGVSKATVSRWESNEIGNMRTDKVKSLCDFLGITTNEFLERSILEKNENVEQISAKEFHNEVKELLTKTQISEQEKTLIEQTLNFICSDKDDK